MLVASNHSAPARKYTADLTQAGGSSTVTSQETAQALAQHLKKQKDLFESFEMTTKMKGLLKGLRYISQIFDNNGKEQEMQIGNPTDVKHVAHIGWDGPSITSPSWMNEFRASTELSSAPPRPPFSTTGFAEESGRKGSSLEDLHRTGAGIDGSVHRDMPLPRPSRRQPSVGESPSRDQPKPRRHQSTTGIAIGSPARDTTDGISRSRRSQNTGSLDSSTLPDQPVEPKKSRRKKSKGSSGGGGSTRPSRSKAESTTTYTSPFSDPGSGTFNVMDNGVCPTSPLRPRGDGGDKGNHGIS